MLEVTYYHIQMTLLHLNLEYHYKIDIILEKHLMLGLVGHLNGRKKKLTICARIMNVQVTNHTFQITTRLSLERRLWHLKRSTKHSSSAKSQASNWMNVKQHNT